jgi:hypothetical protein
MKVVFAGPSLHGAQRDQFTGLDLRPPARQGDIFKAVQAGATAIGLIDGVYEHMAAVWHKEILFALSEGVQMIGGASLGALRAVECQAFGMVGIGRIFEAFADGQLVDDADVALLHGPPELDYLPLSEALVNVRATLDAQRGSGLLSADECSRLLGAAETIFFKQRTWKTIVDTAHLSQCRSAEILLRLRLQPVNQKRLDAEQLIARMGNAQDRRCRKPADWIFARTTLFERLSREPQAGAMSRLCHGPPD